MASSFCKELYDYGVRTFATSGTTSAADVAVRLLADVMRLCDAKFMPAHEVRRLMDAVSVHFPDLAPRRVDVFIEDHRQLVTDMGLEWRVEGPNACLAGSALFALPPPLARGQRAPANPFATPAAAPAPAANPFAAFGGGNDGAMNPFTAPAPAPPPAPWCVLAAMARCIRSAGVTTARATSIRKLCREYPFVEDATSTNGLGQYFGRHAATARVVGISFERRDDGAYVTVQEPVPAPAACDAPRQVFEALALYVVDHGVVGYPPHRAYLDV